MSRSILFRDQVQQTVRAATDLAEQARLACDQTTPPDVAALCSIALSQAALAGLELQRYRESEVR